MLVLAAHFKPPSADWGTRVALITDARGALARAVAGQRVKPADDGAVAAMLVNQRCKG